MISGFIGGAQLGQCDVIHILVDQVIQSAPESQRLALVAAGAFHIGT